MPEPIGGNWAPPVWMSGDVTTGPGLVFTGGGLVARALLPIEPWFIELGGTLDALGALEGERMQVQTAGGFEAGGGLTF